MVRFCLWSKLSLLFLSTTLWAETITKDRFTPVYTLTDDRSASVINANFRKATNILIEDKGFNVVVRGTSTVIQLVVSQVDTNYGVGFQTSWASTFTAVMNKTTENFKVEHSTPGAAGGGTIDWILVR